MEARALIQLMSSRHFPPSYPQGFHYTLKHCSGNRSRKWLNVWYILFQAGSKCQMSSGSQSWPIHPRRRVSAHAASGGLRAAPGRLGAGHRAAHLAAPAAPGAEPRKPSGSRAEAEQSIGACGKCSCSDPNRTHLLASTATSIRCACHEQIQLTHTLLPQSDSHHSVSPPLLWENRLGFEGGVPLRRALRAAGYDGHRLEGGDPWGDPWAPALAPGHAAHRRGRDRTRPPKGSDLDKSRGCVVPLDLTEKVG